MKPRSFLARHYVSFEIFPFSFSEHRILERVEATGKNYAEYMDKGALPILFNLPDAEAGWKAISALRDTILFRDIIRRYRIKDARLLEDVFVYLCTHLAELITMVSWSVTLPPRTGRRVMIRLPIISAIWKTPL